MKTNAENEQDPFADSYQSPLSGSTPSDNTQVFVMVSPPDSVEQVDDEGVFLTPPEHHSHLRHSSSEDLNLNDDAGDGSDTTNKVRVSKLGTDNEPVAKKIRVHEEECGSEVVPVAKTEIIEIEGSSSSGSVCSCEIEEEIIQLKNIVGDKIMETRQKKKVGGGGGSENVVKIPEDGSGNDGKRTDEIDKLPCSGDVDGGGCGGTLVKEKNVEGSEGVEGKGGLLDFLEIVKIIVGADTDDGDEEVDFLETAKKRGLTFPTPRWWPPEGW